MGEEGYLEGGWLEQLLVVFSRHVGHRRVKDSYWDVRNIVINVYLTCRG